MLGAGLLSVLLLSVVRRKLNIAKTVYCWVLQSRGSSYCWVQPSSHHYPPPSTTPVCQCSTSTTGLIVALLPACATNHYFVPNMARLPFNTIKQRQSTTTPNSEIQFLAAGFFLVMFRVVLIVSTSLYPYCCII